MADTKIVPPIVLTSILPFGLSEDGKKFRFSLCIDLRSDYKLEVPGKPGQTYEAEPDYLSMVDFFRNYGLSNNGSPSVFEQLRKNVFIRINGKTPVKGEACFSEFSNVKTYWDSLLPKQSKYRSEEVAAGKFRPNTLSAVTAKSFLDREVLENESLDPQNLFRNSVNAVAAFKAGTFNNMLKAKSEELAKLEKYIGNINNRLAGISEYAAAQNAHEGGVMFKINRSGLHAGVADSTTSIMETFSFISSNVLLQRLFGLTIDFEIDTEKIRALVNQGNDFTMELSTKTEDVTSAVTWQHLTIPMQYFTKPDKGEVIIVKKDWLPAATYKAENYDVGAKLKALSPVRQKIEDYKERIKKEGEKESARYAIMKEVIGIDSAALTRGLNLYNKEVADQVNIILKAKNAPAAITEKEVTRGHRFAVKQPGGEKLISLGSRKVSLVDKAGKPLALPTAFQIQDFAVHTDTGMHALVEDENKNIKSEVLLDSAILTWSGENIGMPGVFSNQEDEENFEANVDEGSMADATEVVTRTFTDLVREEYFPKSVNYTGAIAGVNTRSIAIDEMKLININYSFDKNAKLVLGNDYQLCSVPEYKNGWGISFNGKTDAAGVRYELGFTDVTDDVNPFVPFHFKRNEPVKHIAFYLKDQLLKELPDGINKAPVRGREGESLHHLVIRNKSADNNKETSTTQTSTRYVLPPAISFEHAFWHNKIFELSKDYGMQESYKWYKKYHWPAIDKQQPGKPRKSITEEMITDSIRMKEFYPKDCQINYLPDPLTKGFRLEFYLDKNRLIKATEYEQYEENEYYFSGKYPYINAWEILLEDYEEELVTYKDEKICIRLRKGIELFVTARTILDESYEKQFETFGNYNSFTRYGNNDLLTPPLHFSMVHATQRPLVSPRFNNTLICKKELGSTKLHMVNTIMVEQLSTYTDQSGILNYIEDTVPTGGLELYATWEEYNDDPNNRLRLDDDWDPTKPIEEDEDKKASFEIAVTLNPDQLNKMERTLNKVDNEKYEALNYATDIEVNYDIRETKFLEKQYLIRNKSKFTSYYDAVMHSSGDADVFNRVSKSPFLVKILNSKKPAKPVLAARNMTLVTVHEESRERNTTVRKSSMNRLCLYFERGRLTSGKGERIGILLNDPNSPYNDYFIANGLVSTVGRDILTDSAKPFDGLYRNESVLLTKSNFVINDPHDLRDADKNRNAHDLESFSPEYVEDLGIMTFLPKFDKRLNLWYLHIELDINDKDGQELYNPFLQFGIVHYQENSINENVKDQPQELAKDCRMSEIFKSGFAYIRGSRLITVTENNLNIRVNVSFDETSTIHYKKPVNRFYAFIEEKLKSEVKWTPSAKSLTVPGLAFTALPKEKKYSDELNYIRRQQSDHRLVVLETEEWDDHKYARPEEILENKNCRIVSVNLFKI